MEQHLTAEQARFEALISEYPSLSDYWNFDKKECEEQKLRCAISGMSSGERHIALFFLGLWTGNDEGFDMLSAAYVLYGKERQLLIDWMSEPFWP